MSSAAVSKSHDAECRFMQKGAEKKKCDLVNHTSTLVALFHFEQNRQIITQLDPIKKPQQRFKLLPITSFVAHLPHLNVSVLLLRVSLQFDQKVCTQLQATLDKDKSKRDSGCKPTLSLSINLPVVFGVIH